LAKKEKVVKDTAERWLLTYSDLMNLLLILFILLYTLSKIDTAKYQTIAASLRSAFGEASSAQMIGDGGAAPSMVSLISDAPASVVPSKLEKEQMEQIEENIEEIIKQQGLEGQVDVTLQERGIVISMSEKVLFRSGSAEIEPNFVGIVEKIGGVLRSIPGKQIKVEGHTDSDPINSSRFPDNQELSTARANSVLRILVRNVGIDPLLISATGYGEWRPIAPNNTPENKAKNRRVDIAILKDIYETSESGVKSDSPASGSAAGSNAAGAAQPSCSARWPEARFAIPAVPPALVRSRPAPGDHFADSHRPPRRRVAPCRDARRYVRRRIPEDR
jgi:chemotaxis protein MotB